jgi:hypothetical protein
LPKQAGAFIITACPIVVTLAAITSKVQTSFSFSLFVSVSVSQRNTKQTKLPVEPNLQKNSL